MAKNKEEKQRLSVAATQLEKFQFKVTCFADKLRRFCHWRNQQQPTQQPWSAADFSSSHRSPSPSLFPSATPILPVAISGLCGCGNATHQPSHWGWTPPLCIHSGLAPPGMHLHTTGQMPVTRLHFSAHTLEETMQPLESALMARVTVEPAAYGTRSGSVFCYCLCTVLTCN